jgi:hypothetical protein
MLLNRSDGFGVGPTVNPCTKVNKIKMIKVIIPYLNLLHRDYGYGESHSLDKVKMEKQFTFL